MYNLTGEWLQSCIQFFYIQVSIIYMLYRSVLYLPVLLYTQVSYYNKEIVLITLDIITFLSRPGWNKTKPLLLIAKP